MSASTIFLKVVLRVTRRQQQKADSVSLQDSRRGRCDSLDALSVCDKEAMNPSDHVTFDPEGSDPAVNLEPSPAELAQCEAEVGTLLSIIAELNKKMGSLKAPRQEKQITMMMMMCGLTVFSLDTD